MRMVLLALSGAAATLSAVPVSGAQPVTGVVCTKWQDGICVSTHRVRGSPSPFTVGHVFGPTYSYTDVNTLPQPVVSYYKLGPDYRYVYNNGYLYEIDPNTYAVIKVIDTYPH